MTSRAGNEENDETESKTEPKLVLWYDELGWGRREKFEPWLIAGFNETTTHVARVAVKCDHCGARFHTVLVNNPFPGDYVDKFIADPAYPNAHDACGDLARHQASLKVEFVHEHWEHLGKGTWARRDSTTTRGAA